MNNLPDTIQWLLDFANLSSKPGELNPQRLDRILSFKIKKDTKGKNVVEQIIKHPPIEPSLNITILQPGELPHTGLDSNIVTDDNGYEWLRTRGKPVFLGKKDYHPSLEEFKRFFFKAGIPPYETKESFLITIQDIGSVRVFLKEDEEGKNYVFKGFLLSKNDLQDTEAKAYRLLKGFWTITSRALIRVIRMYNREEDGGFSIKELEAHVCKYYTAGQPNSSDYETVPLDRKGRLFPHDNTLPCAIYAYILDFWYNHKELHSYLRQCKCCGLFWVIQEDRKRGRNRMFCSEACKRVFHQQSRSDNQKAVKTKRTRQKEKKQKEAEKESFEWVSKKGKSFKEFKRTRAVSYGLK